MQNAFHHLNESVYVNVCQRCEYMAATSVIPALMRRSRIWSTTARRELTPCEPLQCMTVGPFWNQEHYSKTELEQNPDLAIGQDDVDLQRLPLFDALLDMMVHEKDKLERQAGPALHSCCHIACHAAAPLASGTGQETVFEEVQISQARQKDNLLKGNKSSYCNGNTKTPEFSWSEIRSLAGNGVTVESIGAVMMFTFSCITIRGQ